IGQVDADLLGNILIEAADAVHTARATEGVIGIDPDTRVAVGVADGGGVVVDGGDRQVHGDGAVNGNDGAAAEPIDEQYVRGCGDGRRADVAVGCNGKNRARLADEDDVVARRAAQNQFAIVAGENVDWIGDGN